MKKYLCLKDLVMKGTGDIELTAGRLYSIIGSCPINNSGTLHLSVDKFGIVVETVEIDGKEWIFGPLSIPENQGIDVYNNWCFEYKCDDLSLLRVVSTGEAKQEAENDMQTIKLYSGTNPAANIFATLSYSISDINDCRDLSPQEAAYAAKQREKALDELAALSADEYRIFPAIKIDEFPVMLGGRFGGHE